MYLYSRASFLSVVAVFLLIHCESYFLIDLLFSFFEGSYFDVGKGSWGKDELVQSTEESSHECV